MAAENSFKSDTGGDFKPRGLEYTTLKGKREKIVAASSPLAANFTLEVTTRGSVRTRPYDILRDRGTLLNYSAL